MVEEIVLVGDGEVLRRVGRCMRAGNEFEWMILDQVLRSYGRLRGLDEEEARLREEAAEAAERVYRMRLEGIGRVPRSVELMGVREGARLSREDEERLRRGRREELRLLRELMREYVRLHREWRKE